jgi:hypothetical protein
MEEYASPAPSALGVESTTLQNEMQDKKELDMDMDANTDKTAVDSTSPSSLDEPQPGKDRDYVTGFKLFALMASITLAAFLLLLDASIVATVSHRLPDIQNSMSKLISKY